MIARCRREAVASGFIRKTSKRNIDLRRADRSDLFTVEHVTELFEPAVQIAQVTRAGAICLFGFQEFINKLCDSA